jgi:hypothetical protein
VERGRRLAGGTNALVPPARRCGTLGAVRISGGVLLLLLAVPSRAVAEETRPPPEPTPAASDRALAGGAAVVPGALVHGAGHFVLGEAQTGRRLLLAEGVGLGMVLAGGSALALTGASRSLAGPAAGVALGGFALFLGSFAADVYGVLSPDADAAGRRLHTEAGAETELGYLALGGPQVKEPGYVLERVSLRAGSLRATTSGIFSARGSSARYRVEGAYRFLGPTITASGRGTSDHVDVVVGAFHHREPSVYVSRSSLELQLDARYDLGHVGPTLRGAFLDFSMGYAAARVAYDVDATRVPGDFDSALLARFGVGAVFRGAAYRGSEAVLYYDHRHDELVGGLVMRGLGSGAAGRFGFDARWYFSRNFGLSLRGEVGSAWLGGASLLFRQEGPASAAMRATR